MVLLNIWDPGSAKAVAAGGARAIGTSSWSVAAANGYGDGEQVPLDFVIDNLTRIVRAIELPVTVDLESGYGKSADQVGSTVLRTIEAGAIGCNIEDSFPETGKLRDTDEQAVRLLSARRTAEAFGIGYFINARTDVFFQTSADRHDEAMVGEALERARAYADAGASGLFAPGLVDPVLIARLAKASPLPLNIMASEKTPALAILADAGVARISHGPGPYLAAMRALGAIT